MIRHARCLMMWALLLCATVTHAGTVTYVYTDPQGTPLAEADANGNITARFEYTPYGVSVPSMGAAPNGVGYTGHVNDPETGLVYMQARYYDAVVGRFLSVDPIGPAAGDAFSFNRYGYASNNPIANIDPYGMQACAAGQGDQNQAPCPPPPPSTPPPKPDPDQAPVLPAVTVTATATGAGGGVAGPWVTESPAIPRWLIAPPNPYVILVAGLIYPGNMATCQEISCAPGLYSNKSRQSKPVNAPPGTIPIDKAKPGYKWDKDKLHKIKDAVGAGPQDWTGVSPDGHIWTTDGSGNGVDNGPWDQLL